MPKVFTEQFALGMHDGSKESQNGLREEMAELIGELDVELLDLQSEKDHLDYELQEVLKRDDGSWREISSRVIKMGQLIIELLTARDILALLHSGPLGEGGIPTISREGERMAKVLGKLPSQIDLGDTLRISPYAVGRKRYDTGWTIAKQQEVSKYSGFKRAKAPSGA